MNRFHNIWRNIFPPKISIFGGKVGAPILSLFLLQNSKFGDGEGYGANFGDSVRRSEEINSCLHRKSTC